MKMNTQNELESKLLDYRVLATRVLAVAIKGSIQDFAVYVDAVEGNNHTEEWQKVARHGNKQGINIAKALFPNLFKKKGKEKLYYRG